MLITITGDKKELQQILADLESHMHQQHMSNLTIQQPEDTLQSLKDTEEERLTRLFKDKERLGRNIERARSISQSGK